jgi:hypothetical protein
LIRFIRSILERDEQFRHPVTAALALPDVAIGAGPTGGSYVFAASRWLLNGDRISERLVFAAMPIDGGPPLEPDMAERLVTTAIMRGQPWLEAPGRLDGERVGRAFGTVVNLLDERYAAYTASAERENRDRVAFQFHQVERQAAREIARLHELIARLRFEGKTRTIKANEGLIARVREISSERLARLQQRSDLTHETALVCAGVLRL